MACSFISQSGTTVAIAFGNAGSLRETGQPACSLAVPVPRATARDLKQNLTLSPHTVTKLPSNFTKHSARPRVLPRGRPIGPCAALQSNAPPPAPEEDIIGSLVHHLGLSEKEAQALTGAMLDGVSKVLEKQHGDNEAQKFSAAFPDLTDWKATARDILLGDNHGGSSRGSGGGLGDVLGDVLGGGKDSRRSEGGILDDIFGGGEKGRSESSGGGGLGGKLGDILGTVLKGSGDEKRGGYEEERQPRYDSRNDKGYDGGYKKYDDYKKYEDDSRKYDADYERGYDRKYKEEEEARRSEKSSGGGLLGGGLGSTIGHLLLKSFLGVGELKLAVNIIKKIGVDPVQTMALAYLLIKFVRGRVGPDIFGMILKQIPLFRLVLDDRNPIVRQVLGAVKRAVLG